jgi:transposase
MLGWQSEWLRYRSTSRRYSPEFKRDAVALLRSSGRSIAQVAKELGVSDMSLSTWAREQAKQMSPEEAEQSEADRLEAIALRKRIKELEQEIEILKRFTAYWVKEGDK